MIKNNAKKFGRLITAIITPFDENLKIDFKGLEKLIEHLLKTGTTSIVVSGTTGESPTISTQEKFELLRFVIEQVGIRAQVIFGSGTNDTYKSIKLSTEAQNLGAQGLLIVAPYYNKPNQEGIQKHYEAIADSTDLPIIIYNIPGRTGVNIKSDTIISLSKSCKNILFLKDSTGSTDQASEIASQSNESLEIYSGDDYLTLPFLAIGACGVISVASHIAGSSINEMMNAFLLGKLEKAKLINANLMPLFKGLFIEPNPTCVKYALSEMGIIKPYVRLPLVTLQETAKKNIQQILANLKLTSLSMNI